MDSRLHNLSFHPTENSIREGERQTASRIQTFNKVEQHVDDILLTLYRRIIHPPNEQGESDRARITLRRHCKSMVHG